jgi:hypothetical protein
MNCPGCSAENNSTAYFCRECGAALVAPASPTFGLQSIEAYQSELDQTLDQYFQKSNDRLEKSLPTLTSAAPTHSDTKHDEFYNLIPSENTKQRKRLEDYIAARADSSIIPGELKLPAFLSELGRTILVPQLTPLPQFSSSPMAHAQELTRNAGGYRITIDHAEWINFAQYHANVSPIRFAKVLNENTLDTERLLFEISILPEEYGHSWQETICDLSPGKAWEASNILLPLSTSRLRAITETERASLRFKLTSSAEVIHVQTKPIQIHPMYQFLYTAGTERFLATYITPNRDSIKNVVGKIARHLDLRTNDPSLSGYQSRSVRRAIEVIRSVHDVLVDDYQLDYINPPPGGGVNRDRGTLLQNVRPVDEILDNKRGTCLDLSILLATLLEAVGLNPLLVLIPGHAFVGCWTVDIEFPSPTVNLLETPELLQAIQTGYLVLFNSTTLCDHARLSKFEEAASHAIHYVNQQLAAVRQGCNGFVKLIDIASCRREGVMALP